MFPSEWLDAYLIINALRNISQQNLVQFVATTGVTQMVDLVVRHFTQPGDVILIEDPSQFLMFVSFDALGVKLVGVPRLIDDPDMVRLAKVIAPHKPKFHVLVSVAPQSDLCPAVGSQGVPDPKTG